MEAAEFLGHVAVTLPDLRIASVGGNHFLHYGPHGKIPKARLPFATALTSDPRDRTSRLDRPGVWRLSINLAKPRYRELFGAFPAASPRAGSLAAGYDFSELDRILPHPTDAPQGWICVLNPGSTWPRVEQLLLEAYENTVRKHSVALRLAA